MQSQFKFKKPKKERVNALDYAHGFLIGVSSSADSISEAQNKAITSAKEMAEGCRKRILADEKADKEDEGRLSLNDIRELRATSNFWDNIAGHIPKVRFK